MKLYTDDLYTKAINKIFTNAYLMSKEKDKIETILKNISNMTSYSNEYDDMKNLLLMSKGSLMQVHY